MGIIGSIILGCLAGFCAGKLMKGGGFGLIMNLVLGLFGGLVGGWLFTRHSHHRRRSHPLGRLADQEVKFIVHTNESWGQSTSVPTILIL